MSQCLQTTSACGTSEAYNTTMSVTVGQVVVAQGYCNAVGATGTGGLRIDWLNSAGTLISSSASLTTVTGTSGWVLCKVVATAPATAISARLAFFTNSCAAGYFQFDDSLMQLQSSSLDEVPQGSTYKSVTAVDSNGKALVDFSQSGHLNKTLDNIGDGTTYVRPKYINSDGTIHVSTLLNAQGNIITYQPINYSTSWTKTTASVSILAQTLLRGDGSSITVNTSSISYTGLAPGTTYYLYPYINIATGNLAAANGNPPPTIQNGTMATQACGDGFLSLGPVFITTMTTIGSGGNTGGGGCPESEELVDVEGRGQIKAGAIVVGDCIRGKSLATDKDVYRKVIQMRQETCHAWRVIDGHKNSPCESVYHEGQWLPAFRVEGAIVNQDAGIKTILVVEADSYGEHNFYLTAGTPLLIHNGASES